MLLTERGEEEIHPLLGSTAQTWTLIFQINRTFLDNFSHATGELHHKGASDAGECASSRCA